MKLLLAADQRRWTQIRSRSFFICVHLRSSAAFLLCLGLLVFLGAGKKSPEAGVVSLDVQADGDRVHLLIGESEIDRPATLKYLRSADGGETWTGGVAVGANQPAPQPLHRGMDAQIAASGDKLVAVWTTGADTRMGRGPLASAVSTDAGVTWRPGPSPSDAGEIIDHAFIDLATDAAGTIHCVWLDGRRGQKGKGLRYARSTDGGATWSPNATLDPETCECCPNRIVAHDQSVHVLYRNRNPRDMAILTSTDGGLTWNAPVTVGGFNWTIDGCPHVGGAVAISGTTLFATAWTAKGEPDRGAFVLTSTDTGRSWSAPVQLGNNQSWRTDLAVSNGTLFAAWDAYVESGTTAFFATSNDAGATWSPPAPLNPTGTTAAQPKLLSTPAGIRAFWTEKREGQPTVWTSRTFAAPIKNAEKQ